VDVRAYTQAVSRITPLLSPLLIGRDDLLDLADRRLADAAEGRGHFLLLAGEAGIGKSRLIAALGRKAQALGFMFAEGDLAPQDRIVPGALVQDLVRNMLKIRAFDRLDDDFVSVPDALPGTQFQSRRLLVHDLVDRLAESLDEPALLAIEDLQWADDLSLEIVAELARRIRDLPVMIVGAYRTDELPTGTILREWRARLLTQRMAEEARLAPLTLDQTALMTTLILSTGLPAPREVVAAVYERTDGIPLHIEELLGALTDEARSDGRAIREATVPATIEDAVLARFERLSAEGRAVAQAGAVIGRCFVPEVLAGILDLPPDSLDTPLQELVDQAFLYPFSSRDVGFFDYRHQLLRDVLYRTVPRATLRRLHARAGEFGAQLEGASEIHASAHFERAGLHAEAFRAAMSGASTAARISSHREAFELYRRAVDNMPATLGLAEQGLLFEAYSEEAAAIERHEATEMAARVARDRYVEAGRSLEAARMLGRLAALSRREAGPIDEPLALTDQALTELEALPVTPEREAVRSEVLGVRGASLFDAMDLVAARATASAMGEAARAAGAEGDIIDSDALIGLLDVLEGDTQPGLAAVGRAARAAREAGFETISVTAYRDGAAAAARVMDYEAADASLVEGLRYADAVEQSHCRHIMRATAALVAWAGGRWDEAVTIGEQELADGGCARGTMGADVAAGYVALGRGALDRARELFESSLGRAALSGAVDLVLPALWGLAELDLLAGEPEAALERCAAATELAIRVGERALLAPFLVTCARAHLAAGRPEAGERWVNGLRGHFDDWESTVQAPMDHAQGLIRLATGSTGLARASLEAAVRGWDERGRIWESTWARVDLASCLVRSSRFADAAGHLASARETATRLDSAPLMTRIQELSDITSRHGSFDEPWRPLTSREFEVARLIASGLTNAEIAGELSIAPKTASAHVEHILAKLGVARRAEIATWVATVALPTAEMATVASRGVMVER